MCVLSRFDLTSKVSKWVAGDSKSVIVEFMCKLGLGSSDFARDFDRINNPSQQFCYTVWVA